MKKFEHTVIAVICGIIAFFMIMGLVGDYDYCEQVILHMSQEQYDSVKNTLADQTGKTPSDRDIAHWWADHHNK